MGNGRWLKAVRVAASAMMLAVVTVAFIGLPLWLLTAGMVAVSVQLVPAVLSLGMGTFVAWAIATLLLGRVYCSTVCPLGVVQDIVARLRPGRHYRYRPSQRRYALLSLCVVIACALGGLSVMLVLLDPYSQYGRLVSLAVSPSWVAAGAAALTLAVVGVMAWRGGRLYCNTICPVGGALGLVSRVSLLHIEIDPDRCVRCNRCVAVCKASCIDIQESTVDNARCVACFNCLTRCDNDAIHYTLDRKQLMTPMFQRVQRGSKAAQPSAMRRRDFLGIALTATLAPALSACSKAGKRVEAAAAAGAGGSTVPTATTVAVAPPGAITRRHFLDTCTGCGLCISSCPARVLKPSTTEYGVLRLLHPVMDYDASSCLYECHRCTEVCPTGALERLTLAQKQLLAIGLAEVTPPNCLHCGACASACPTGACKMVAAASGDYLPQVDPALCIGCGACQHICPARPYKAIIVNGLQDS